jgi:glycine/D-amino acid oxidase-like deaminating enzyme
MTTTTDFLVIGGGITGISITRELRRRHPDAVVAVLETEPTVGRHASGRNSGVVHASFYYTADSLKARFTRDGNAALRDYCREKGLPLSQCGKLVVGCTAADHPQMDELLRCGAANGVTLESITEAEVKRIEPRVKTCERAIWSPNTASADPGVVIAAMRSDADREGVRAENYRRWGRSGIRAQLLDTRTRKLEMDFVLEGDDRSLHVLNAVRPAGPARCPSPRTLWTPSIGTGSRLPPSRSGRRGRPVVLFGGQPSHHRPLERLHRDT